MSQNNQYGSCVQTTNIFAVSVGAGISLANIVWGPLKSSNPCMLMGATEFPKEVYKGVKMFAAPSVPLIFAMCIMYSVVYSILINKFSAKL